MQNEIFGISLNEEGRRQITKFNSLAGILFLISILITIIGLFNFYLRLNYFGLKLSENPIIRSQIWASRIYSILFHLLFPFQVYYYFRFARENKNCIALGDSDGFNRSFRFLFVNASLSVFTFLLNLLYVTFVTYTDWAIIHRVYK